VLIPILSPANWHIPKRHEPPQFGGGARRMQRAASDNEMEHSRRRRVELSGALQLL